MLTQGQTHITVHRVAPPEEGATKKKSQAESYGGVTQAKRASLLHAGKTLRRIRCCRLGPTLIRTHKGHRACVEKSCAE